MEPKAFSELFPIFNTGSPETLEWFLSVAEEEKYSKEQAILSEDSWGKAVYFIVSGWVKLRYLLREDAFTGAIWGRGDFFGEMAILDESPRSTEVIALSDVKLLSISAQRFIQALFKDNQLQYRMLKFMVRRLRQLNLGCQLRHQPPAVQLVKTLVFLAEQYGQSTEKGTEIYNIPDRDLADVTDIKVNEIEKIMENLQSNGWIEIDISNETLSLINLKQLIHLAGKI